MSANTTDNINAFLDAYTSEQVRIALRMRSKREREKRVGEGWMIWTKEELPPKEFEWRKINGVIQYRPPQGETNHRKVPKNTRQTNKLHCPICGEDMFPQPVCPNCLKGKAGLKTQWICGSNSDHVIYTEG